MYILGIDAYHAGASACLIQDGVVVAAAEEERFNRIKYCAGFPTRAIEWCLSEAGISAYDLAHVGISRNPSASLHKKVLYTLRRRPSFNLIRDRLANAARARDPKPALVEALGLRASDLKAEFHNVEHHLAHTASAFFVSPYPEAAVQSVDGMGDFCSTMWGVGRGNCLEVKGSVNFPHSLGIFYTAVAQWLGFTKYRDEGKVMGLAPYGEPTHLEEMRRIVRPQRDGTFELDLDWFVHHAGGATMTWESGSPELCTLYSAVPRSYYPTILRAPSTVVPHVHDLHLRTLLDFGIPGLFAQLATVGTAAIAGLAAVRGRVQVSLASGLLLGLVAHATYSLVDAVTLGAKPGVLLWAMLGLLLAVGARIQTLASSIPEQRPGQSMASGEVPPPRSTWAARFRSRWVLAGACALVSPLILAGVALNAATLTLHHGLGTASAVLETDLQLAQTFAAGPVLARVYPAWALLAHHRGDAPAELESLTVTMGSAWDPSIALQAGDLRLAYGHRPRAADAWRAAGAVQSLLDRAATSPGNQALDWYNLAQAVDPTDWRPYAGAGHVLASSDPNRAAATLSEAPQFRGADPARASLAHRLVDGSSQLASNASIDRSPDEAQLLVDASQLLVTRSDLPGSLVAAQLSTEADPAWSATWQQLDFVRERVGSPRQAEDARAHAQSRP